MQRSRFAWSLAVAFGTVSVASLIPACGPKEPPPPPPEEVLTWGQFCNRAGTAFCQCAGGGVGTAVAACVEGAQFTCLAGKDPNTLSDRTTSQSAICEGALSRSCTTVITGTLPPECPPLIPAGYVFPTR